MKKNTTIGIAIIAAILMIGGYWYLSPQFEATTGFEPIPTEFGNIRHDILLKFVDGSEIYMSEAVTETMTVYYLGLEVWQATYQVFATATSTDFTSAEVDMSGVSHNARVVPQGTGPYLYDQDWSYGPGTITLPLGVETLLVSDVVNLNPIFVGQPEGDYLLVFEQDWNDDQSSGFKYRGLPAGSWEFLDYSATNALTLSKMLNLIDGEVTVDWTSDVVWN